VAAKDEYRRSARGPSSLPRPRRRPHHMDVPLMRPDGVRAAAQHPLPHPWWAGGSAHLQRRVVASATLGASSCLGLGWRADSLGRRVRKLEGRPTTSRRVISICRRNSLLWVCRTSNRPTEGGGPISQLPHYRRPNTSPSRGSDSWNAKYSRI